MTLGLIVGVPWLLALGAAGLRGRMSAAWMGRLAALGLAVLFGVTLTQLPVVLDGVIPLVQQPWMPQVGLAFTLVLDGLALLFVLLVTGMGALIMLYAGDYFEESAEAGRFLALLLAFCGAMLLLVLAGNLLTLFIAWELTSILSFLLISFKGGKDAGARGGASQALMITGGGGLALLVGLLLAGTAAGTFELPGILLAGDVLRAHPWYSAITVLIVIGCFAKSAQFPLHFWLPGAMSAPTPASAFLHSATMVKAGIYLLARMAPALGDTPLWTAALVGFGLATLLIGAVLALGQRDLKGMLAFSTISQLGALVALLGVPGNAGIKAAMVGVLAHALYKGALFLVAGAVDHATGTRDITRLGGLRRIMPGFTLVALVAALSMAGVPPLFGFVGKETLLEAFVEDRLQIAIVVVAATLTVAVALRLFWDVFMGAPGEAAQSDHLHALPRTMVVGPASLAVGSVVFGLAIGPLVAPLVGLAVGQPTSLYLFPPGGVNAALVLSMSALALGAVVFALRQVWLGWAVAVPVSGPQVYRSVVRAVEAFGDLLLRSQNGKIRYYLVVIFVSVVLLLSVVLFNDIGTVAAGLTLDFRGAADALRVLLLGITIAGTIASIIFKKHIVAVLALGAAGYAVGGLFALEPAPDVALVQFLVETLVTVLLVVMLARTRESERRQAIEVLWGQTRRGLVRDAAVATLVGSAVAIFAVAAVVSRPTPDAVAGWYLANAQPLVGTDDVVAGIITDFRGTDTLMEITVFAVASLGVVTLLARPVNTVRAEEDAEATGEPVVYQSPFRSASARIAAAVIVPLSMMLAVAHLLYAGAAPGDGFTAGVVVGLAVALAYVVYGYEEARRALRWLHPVPVIGVGLLIAIGNALLPMLWGAPFFAHSALPSTVLGIKLSSALVFEVGIFMVVMGGVAVLIEAISHEEEVEPV